MITIFTQDCNQISQSFYNSIIDMLQFHQLTCSCGHSACLSIHGYYNRNVKIPSGTLRLRICRVRCSQCQRTHAILPASIVPYSQIALHDHQKICLYLEEHKNVWTVCDENPSIDENNVKSVIRSYRRHWREKLRSFRIPLSTTKELIRLCFLNYSEQFMQVHRGDNLLFSSTT